jgi:hypothetical protein
MTSARPLLPAQSVTRILQLHATALLTYPLANPQFARRTISIKKYNANSILSCILIPIKISIHLQLKRKLCLLRFRGSILGAFFEKKEKDMTLSPVTSRFAALASAAIASSFLLAAAPLTAAAAAPHYKVELSKPLSAPKNKMVKGSFFRCAENICTSTSDASSAKNMCTWVVREFGEVKSFQAGNRALTADELAKCNKK